LIQFLRPEFIITISYSRLSIDPFQSRWIRLRGVQGLVGGGMGLSGRSE